MLAMTDNDAVLLHSVLFLVGAPIIAILVIGAVIELGVRGALRASSRLKSIEHQLTLLNQQIARQARSPAQVVPSARPPAAAVPQFRSAAHALSQIIDDSEAAQ